MKKSASLIALLFMAILSANAQENVKKEPIVIDTQGSFAVGGSILQNPGTFNPITRTPEGQTFHGDHAYITYQKPVDARALPMVFWHGIGQFSKTWETTPDGREGFQSIFLRRGYSVYLITQPRRGNAGRSTVPTTINPVPDEQEWFSTFRLGVWPNFFVGFLGGLFPSADHFSSVF